MQLKTIKLLNFRQFYGNQKIDFSTDSEKNVTLIHAENGVGKTTLLNALLWCFYKDTTTKFELPENIVSEQAIKENKTNASVEVIFLDKGKTYSVIRKIDQENHHETFEAFKIETGNYEKLQSADVFVESIIPKEMSKYFFFDGEYAETFSSSNNRRAVQTAVESMLGCNIALQALEDLENIRKKLKKEMGDASKNDQQAKIYQKKLDDIDDANSILKQDLSDKNKELDGKISTKEKISKSLRETAGAKEIQILKDEYEEELKRLKNERANIEIEETKWIYNDSFGLLSKKISSDCSEFIEDAKTKKLLPGNIAYDFINKTLESEICICGRKFSKNSQEAIEISKLKKDSTTQLRHDRFIAINSRISRLADLQNTSVESYKSIIDKLSSHDELISTTELKILDCKTKLGGNEIRDIAEKQNAINALDSEIAELNMQIGGINQTISSNDEEYSDWESKLEKRLKHDKNLDNVRDMLSVLEASKEFLEIELSNYREESRISIKSQVDDILKITARRNYHSSIDETFNLNMHYSDTDQVVAKSNGENQLLSLAFIASLVRFSADRRGQSNKLLKPGTMAPLMLDSPFGQLDPTYQESTANFLPNSSGQVILLLSKTQGAKKVLDALNGRIGEECVLISEVTAERGEKPLDIIDVGSEKITCSIYEAEKDRTIIRSLTRG